MIARRLNAMPRLRRLLVAWLACALGLLPLAGYAHLHRTVAGPAAAATPAACQHADAAADAGGRQADAPCCCCDGPFHQAGCKAGCASAHVTAALPPLSVPSRPQPSAGWASPAIGRLSGLVTEPPFHPPRG